jgi:hypothetical protein
VASTNTKDIKLKVHVLAPDGVQFKPYGIVFVPPDDQPIFVHMEVDGKYVTRRKDGSIHIKLKGLFLMAEEIRKTTKIIDAATYDARDKAVTRAAKKPSLY